MAAATSVSTAAKSTKSPFSSVPLMARVSTFELVTSQPPSSFGSTIKSITPKLLPKNQA
ncbi:hypothetical protein ACOBV8_12260 [Pseudoalteromonas espejiana]